MKKRVLYFLLLLFSAFGFFSTVKAEVVDRFDVNYSFVAIGQNQVLQKEVYTYKNLQCPTTGTGHVTVTFKAYDDSNPTGDGWYDFKYSSNVTSVTTESITCTWDANAPGYAEHGTTTVTFTLNPAVLEYGSTITLSGRLQPGYMDSNSNIAENFYIDHVISSEVTSGGEYINWNCPAGGTSCVVTGKNTTSGVTQQARAKIVFTRDTDPGKTWTLNLLIYINYFGSPRAYPGGYKCDFNTSQWQIHEGEDPHDYDHISYYYALVNDGLVFPSCEVKPEDASRTPKRIFKGWSKSASTGKEVQVAGLCASMVEVNGGGTVNAGDLDNAGANNYFSCFEYEAFIGLRVSGGTLNPSAGWEEILNSTIDYANYSSSATLPDVTFPEGRFGQTVELSGWSCSDGKTHQPGETVNSGVVCAAIKTSTSSYIDLNKSVFVGRDLVIAISNKKISSCSVTSGSHVTTKVEDSKCIVTGVTVTEEGSPDDVTVTTDDGTTRVYKITVKELGAGDVSFIIDAPIHGVISGSGSSSDFMGASVCTHFKVGGDGERHVELHTNEDALHSSYKVVSLCGDGTAYASVCLDPARTAPAGQEYIKVEDIKPGSELGKVVQAAVNRIGDNDSLRAAFTDYNVTSGEGAELRAATQIAARIVGIATGKYVQGAGPGYSGNHYEWYENAADALNALGPDATIADIEYILTDSGLFPSCHNNENEACYMTSEILQYVMQAEAGDTSSEDQQLRKELDAGYPKAEVSGSNGYRITYKGKIIAPSSLTIEGIENCDDSNAAEFGVKCYSSSIGDAVSSGSTNSYDFEVVIGTDNASNVKIPHGNAEKLKVAFKLKTSGATVNNAFVIAPVDSVEKQRMLMFDMDDSGDIYVYFSPIPQICLYEIEALKASNCTSAETCSINKALFKASKCCEQIADESNPSLAYLLNTVCNANCTTSTIEQVCDYANLNTSTPDADADKSELYQIREGSYKEGDSWKMSLSALPDGSGGACVVNVVDTKNSYYEFTGSAVIPGSSRDTFTTYDDMENVRNLKEYKDNRFCTVTCKEDFQLVMPAFGNYIGDRAAAAGRFFALDGTRIFMGGSMSCYTTFLNYYDYATIQDELSAQIVENYNGYATNNHGYTEMEQLITYDDDIDTITDTKKVKVCTAYSKTYCSSPITCDGTDPTCTPGCAVDYEYECSSTAEVEYPYGFTYSRISPRYDDSDGESGEAEYTHYEYTRGGEDDHGELDHDAEDFKVADHEFSCTTDYTTTYVSPWHSSTQPSTHGYFSCDYNDHIDDSDALADLKQDAWDTHYEEDKKDLQDTGDGFAQTMNGLSDEMHKNAEDFYYCQHFALYTYRIGDAAEAAKAVMDEEPDEWGVEYVLGVRVTPKVVGVDFNPYARYTYDENQYMQTLKDDNLLIRDDITNIKLSGNENFGKTGESIKAEFSSFPAEEQYDFIANADEFDDALYNNYLENGWYVGKNDGHEAWDPGSGVAKNYGECDGVPDCESGYKLSDDPGVVTRRRAMCAAGGMYTSSHIAGGKGGPYRVSDGKAEWVEGHCFIVELKYRKVNYIRRSIKNSSFFRNKGLWWQGPNSIRVHGDYLYEQSDADVERFNIYGIYGYEVNGAFDYYASVYGKTFDDPDGWSFLDSELNVFPISFTTARNLYQYSYQFSDVGTFFDEARLGRLMGTEEAIIQSNTRTCFYEVYENICHCCGDPIEFHTSYLEGSTSKEDTEAARSTSDRIPDPEKVKDTYENVAGDATLNFFTTVSSLSDLSAITESGDTRELANNWGDAYFSFAAQSNLVTHQGTEAKDAIEFTGDGAYAKTPEYSYSLTPEVIQKIREYNAQHDYVYNVEYLNNKGTYSVVPMEDCSSAGSCEWTESPVTPRLTNNVAFSHMGSAFLELDYMMDAATDETRDRIRNGEICSTIDKDIRNYDSIKNCRWVDYVEDNAYDQLAADGKSQKLDHLCGENERYDYNTDTCIKANYFRLAYK